LHEPDAGQMLESVRIQLKWPNRLSQKKRGVFLKSSLRGGIAEQLSTEKFSTERRSQS
jgi:hypothetical protein